MSRRRPRLHLVRRGVAGGVHELNRPRLGLFLNRDVIEERGITRLAALAAAVNADALNQFAEQRAGTGPVRNLRSRDFDQETREELADARNYIVWRLRQLRLSGRPDPDREASLEMALSHVAVAWHYVDDGQPLTQRRRAA